MKQTNSDPCTTCGHPKAAHIEPSECLRWDIGNALGWELEDESPSWVEIMRGIADLRALAAPAGPQAEGAGETGDVRVEAVMADPGVADWGGEMTEQGTPIYHHPWDSDDGELRLWVGPHDGQLDSGWTVSLSARGLDVDLHTDPERILRWLDGVRQAITLSREEASGGAGETMGGAQ